MRASLPASLTKEISAEERLARLQKGDRHRAWRSLDDRRACLRCARAFTGHEVELVTMAGGQRELHCPTIDCDSTPLHWLFCGREPGAPGAARMRRRATEVDFAGF